MLLFPLAGCSPASSGNIPLASIQTYQDIPGVTEEEISAIEALKKSRDSLSYGILLGTEFFILPDGSPAGFTKIFCEFLTDLFGISFIPELYEWDKLMDGLESQELDFTGELTPTEERMQKYGMSLPIADRSLRIFTQRDSGKFRIESDIEGLTLGFLDGSITEDSIRKTYHTLSFNSVNVASYPVAAMMIANGGIDVFVGEAVSDPAFEEYDFIHSQIFFPMLYEAISLTTANSGLIPIISVVNKYLLAGGFRKLDEFYKDGDFEYAKYKLYKSFTSEERVLIDDLRQRGQPVTIALENDNYPVCFYNEKEKQFQGIVPDILAEISKLTDIQFMAAIEKDATWPEIFGKMRTGEIQMISQLLYSEARKDHFIWSAVPYAHSYYAIMSRSDYPNLAGHQIMQAKVGVLRNSAYEDMYYELFSDRSNLMEYDTREACLDALERGEVDLLMASEYMLLTQIHYHEKPDFKINIKLNAPLNSNFGFHKDENILCSIIDKTQRYVQTDIIEISWTSRVFDYAKKFAEEIAVFLTGSVTILLLLLFITIFLLARNLKLSKRLKQIASHDALTGILNRRYFLELGLNQIDRTIRLKKDCFLIIFDLDHFKIVNDTYGHQAGDKVLRDVAQRVKKSVRPYDLFGRYGGEEFIMLMFDVDKAGAINAVERIRQDVCGIPVVFEDKQIPISASFGIAYAAPPRDDLGVAIKRADEALYHAKEGGRNMVFFYEDSQ